MIPRDVTTILDVGCGDGRIVQRLPKYFKATGVDYSYNSLRQLIGNGVCASSESLPFRDKSFDLVLCCEVLEHLPDEMFKITVAELERISRNQILISVPYKENLRSHDSKCLKCCTIFHIWGHVRRFSNPNLDRLLANKEVNVTRYVGRRAPYHSRNLLYVNQRFGNRWADFSKTTICPNCCNTSFTRTPRNLVTIACGIINLLTLKLVPVLHKNWVLKLYSQTR